MTILQKHLVFIPLFLVVMVTLLGALVMWLWNWLMPMIFGLPTLTFWHAVGQDAAIRRPHDTRRGGCEAAETVFQAIINFLNHS